MKIHKQLQIFLPFMLVSLSLTSFGIVLKPTDSSPLNYEVAIPSFKNDIWPLIQKKCTSDECHGSKSKEDVKFTDYNSVKAKAKRIKKRVGNIMLPMPPNDSDVIVTKAEITLLKNWIAAGAPNN